MAFESVYAQKVKLYVILPDPITELDPAWASCGLSLINVETDPPRALKPADNIAPEVTSVATPPQKTPAIPHRNSDPPGPTPTVEPVSGSTPHKANPGAANNVDPDNP